MLVTPALGGDRCVLGLTSQQLGLWPGWVTNGREDIEEGRVMGQSAISDLSSQVEETTKEGGKLSLAFWNVLQSDQQARGLKQLLPNPQSPPRRHLSGFSSQVA